MKQKISLNEKEIWEKTVEAVLYVYLAKNEIKESDIPMLRKWLLNKKFKSQKIKRA